MNYAALFRATLPETALELAALLVLVVDLAFLRKATQRMRTASATALGVIGCIAAYLVLPTSGASGFSVDGATLLGAGGYIAVAQIGILFLTALTLILLIDSLFTRHVGEFVAVMLMSAAGGLIIAAAQDLIVIFIGLELLSLGLYILTAFAKKSSKSAEAAIKYYLFGGMSAAFLLFGFSYFYGLSGTTNLSFIQEAITSSQATIAGPDASPLLYIAWICVLAGLGFKIAAFPFHLWAPDTYEGAPAPAAAFIASVSKVASFALLSTISIKLLAPHFPNDLYDRKLLSQLFAAWTNASVVLLVVAAASMVVGNLAALAQVSVRRLLAYSAIAHAGYILLGVATYPTFAGNGYYLGIVQPAAASSRAVLYYVLTYALTTIGAFGVVDVVERATGSDKLESFLGLHKRNPVLAAVLLILFLSLAGIPPLVGFWAKFNLFAAVLAVGAGPIPFALVALAVAFSAVSLYYYIQVLKRAYVMPAAPGTDESPIRAHPVTMTVLVLIAAAVVVLGCFPSLLGNWIASFY